MRKRQEKICETALEGLLHGGGARRRGSSNDSKPYHGGMTKTTRPSILGGGLSYTFTSRCITVQAASKRCDTAFEAWGSMVMRPQALTCGPIAHRPNLIMYIQTYEKLE